MILIFSRQNVYAKKIDTAERVIVIAPKVFNSSIQQWIKYRSSQGYDITLINADDSNSPLQIRQKISSVALASRLPVTAILIVGNAVVRTESDRGYVIPSPRLPCKIINEFANDPHLASDDWYADFNNDNHPDCSVGRFPANSVETLDMLIEKTIRYETEIKPDLWRRQIQVVAGVGNFSPLIDSVIESAAHYVFMKKLPSSYETAFLYANWKSVFCPSPIDIRNEYTATLNRSPMFWIYIGHGYHRSLQSLSTPHGQIRTLGDSNYSEKQQENHNDAFPTLSCKNSLPIVMLLCCYGGVLDAKTKSTAEELFLQKNGAAAIIATSRASMPYGLTVFGTECLDEFISRQNKPEKILLGSIIFETKKRMLTTLYDKETTTKSNQLNFTEQKIFRQNITNIAKWLDPFPTKLDLQLEEHVEQIHLFGDPLLVIQQLIPIKLDVPQKIKSGSKIKIKGEIQTEFLNQVNQHNLIKKHNQNINNNKYNFTDINVLIDLAISSEQISFRSDRREKIARCDISTRQADNDEYQLANQHIIARYIVPVSSDGIFETEIPSTKIPSTKNLYGKHIIRVFCKLPEAAAAGSANINLW
ncbi:MAG: C25 family cysteine peptidase [Planctomycetaceae bacterium]|nr:C25 family cysteine peptidase [Planctomycetaceae bacterium]